MTGFETALIISQLAGPIMSMFGGGGSQGERQSFEGSSVDPERMLGQANILAGRLGRALSERAGQPINLPSAYAQQPGAYTGGGLPFPIGLVAQDPALANPSLLTRPGATEFAHLFDNLGEMSAIGGVHANDGVGIDGYQPHEDAAIDPTRTAVPKSLGGGAPQAEPVLPASAGPRRRSNDSGAYGQLVRASDLTDQGANGDDLKKAMGSVNLLLQAYGLPSA